MLLISAAGEIKTSLYLDNASSRSPVAKASVFGDALLTGMSKYAIYRW